jgi:hypothetical protein
VFPTATTPTSLRQVVLKLTNANGLVFPQSANLVVLP